LLLGKILSSMVKIFNRVKVVSVVTIDERGRLTIPKELGVRGTKAIIIQREASS
jgi:hypothetical protein